MKAPAIPKTPHKYKTSASASELWAEKAIVSLSAARARVVPALAGAALAAARLAGRYGPVAVRWAGDLAARGIQGAARSMTSTAGGAREAAARRPSRATRKVWVRQLERLGRPAVRDYLNSHAVGLPSGARLQIADAGITFGTNRHPTHAFVLGWLGSEPQDDADLWRHRLNLFFALVGLVAAVIGIAFLLA